MIKRTQEAFAVLAFLLGLAHIIFGITVFKTLNIETFWFHGFGIAMILAALANLREDKIWILRIQNTLIFSSIMILVYITPQPQILLGCCLFGTLFLMSWIKKKVSI